MKSNFSKKTILLLLGISLVSPLFLYAASTSTVPTVKKFNREVFDKAPAYKKVLLLEKYPVIPKSQEEMNTRILNSLSPEDRAYVLSEIAKLPKIPDTAVKSSSFPTFSENKNYALIALVILLLGALSYFLKRKNYFK